MPAQTFPDFCHSLCSLMVVPAPALVAGEGGAVGFAVTCNGVNVSFVAGEYGRGREPAMLMAVTFGVPPPEQELEVLRNLMDANFVLSGAVPPAFVRNPASGEISLHQSYLMSQVDVHGIYQGVVNAAAAVREWKVNPVLGESQMPRLGSGAGINLSDLA